MVVVGEGPWLVLVLVLVFVLGLRLGLGLGLGLAQGREVDLAAAPRRLAVAAPHHLGSHAVVRATDRCEQPRTCEAWASAEGLARGVLALG